MNFLSATAIEAVLPTLSTEALIDLAAALETMSMLTDMVDADGFFATITELRRREAAGDVVATLHLANINGPVFAQQWSVSA